MMRSNGQNNYFLACQIPRAGAKVSHLPSRFAPGLLFMLANVSGIVMAAAWGANAIRGGVPYGIAHGESASARGELAGCTIFYRFRSPKKKSGSNKNTS
jgi:hypothetical protein